MSIDNAVNFGKVTVLAGHNSSDTSIALQSGNGALLPVAPFNVVWWNSAAFADPSDDPNKEIVRVTAGGGGGGGDTLTVTRGVEGTGASTKNTAGGIYKMIAGLTAKVINTDILSTGFTAITLANGLNSNISLSTVPVGAGGTMRIRITGPTAAFSLGGFTNGVDGLRLFVINDTIAQVMTVVNLDASSSAGNKISTFQGANVAIGTTHGGLAQLMYDSNVSSWVLVGTFGA